VLYVLQIQHPFSGSYTTFVVGILHYWYVTIIIIWDSW